MHKAIDKFCKAALADEADPRAVFFAVCGQMEFSGQGTDFIFFLDVLRETALLAVALAIGRGESRFDLCEDLPLLLKILRCLLQGVPRNARLQYAKHRVCARTQEKL